MRSEQVLPVWIPVYIEINAMEGYFTLSRTRTLTSSAVLCHTRDSPFLRGHLPYTEDTASVFYGPPSGWYFVWRGIVFHLIIIFQLPVYN